MTYTRAGGDPEAMRATVRQAVRSGCKGACLADCVRSMNAAMNRGTTGKEASGIVRAAIRNQAREKAQVGSDDEKGRRIRARVEARLARMDQDRDRVRERERARLHQQDGPAGKSSPGR